MGMDIYSRTKKIPENGEVPSADLSKWWEEIGNDPANGYYCRYNIWGWSAMMPIITLANDTLPQPHDLSGWHYNSGLGLADAGECQELANALEGIIERSTEGTRSQVVGWGPDGNTYEERPYLTLPNGDTSSLSKEHAMRFVHFLRACGDGFEIW